MRQKKQRRVAFAVGLALGLGVTGHAQAQEPEGVKGYVTGQVVNFRLVNPLTNNLVTAGVAASGQGTTNGRITVDNIADERFATPGSWNTLPAINEPDAEQACINGDGVDYQASGGVAPPCPQNVFPGGNDFNQVGDDVTVNGPFEDFGRSDVLVVPGTSIAIGQPDVDIDGDDITFVAACQRSAPAGFVGAKFAASDTANEAFSQRFFLADTETPTQNLEFRGDFSGRAEAIASDDLSFATATAINAILFRIQRVSDGADIDCDTSPIELAAEVLAPNEDDESEVPAGITLTCDAGGFPDGTDQEFVPGENYDFTASLNAQANCTLAREVGNDVFKVYFGKQSSTRPADEPLTPPVGPIVVSDQFFPDRLTNVRFLRGLMTPAGKNEPVGDRTEHLTCYETVDVPGQGHGFPPDVTIVTDNFGEQTFTLGLPKELCVSAAKTRDGVTEGSPEPPPVFKCYTARGAAEGQFALNDQFGDELVEVTRLSRLCVPANKETPVPPATDPNEFDHLACFEFDEVEPGPIPPFIDVLVEDQFNTQTMAVEKPERFCEPARKIAINGEPL